MVSGFVWFIAFAPFVERLAEAGFFAGLLGGRRVRAVADRGWRDGR